MFLDATSQVEQLKSGEPLPGPSTEVKSEPDPVKMEEKPDVKAEGNYDLKVTLLNENSNCYWFGTSSKGLWVQIHAKPRGIDLGSACNEATVD